MLPEVLKNATPASAAIVGESIVTPEMSTRFSSASVEPSDWREIVTTLPPPSRRYGALPASEPLTAIEGLGSISTLLAPAPTMVSGLLIVSPLCEPACAGLAALVVGVDPSRYVPGQTMMVSCGAA